MKITAIACVAAAMFSSVSAQDKIVGGVVAEEGRWPWIAGLYRSGASQPSCGGTLIAPNVVLSAAHCNGIAATIRIGCYRLGQSCETHSSFTEIIHPSYNGGRPVPINDFVIYRLSGTSSIAPIPYIAHPAQETQLTSGLSVSVAGWGDLTDGGSPPTVLNEVEVKVVSQSSCTSAYGSSYVTAAMFCASDPGQDSCQGDSGGPIIIKCADPSNDMLLGVVSWGNGCAIAGYPGVYGRISNQYDWIAQQVANAGYTLANPPAITSLCSGTGAAPTAAPDGTSPTPFPVAAPSGPPASWNCNVNYYNTNDGCDCDCGAPDPDCVPGATLYGCSLFQTCNAAGECVSTATREALAVKHLKAKP